MGYYTYFTISVDTEDSELLDRINIAMGEDPDYFSFFERSWPGETFTSVDGLKWYDYESDMKKFSLQFPDATFEVRGEGEENDDLWVAWFKNGKGYTQHAEIVWPEFDENKMKE